MFFLLYHSVWNRMDKDTLKILWEKQEQNLQLVSIPLDIILE